MENLDCPVFVTVLPQAAQCFDNRSIAVTIDVAMEHICTVGIVTLDLRSKATTQEVTRAVSEVVRGTNLPEGARA